MAVAGVLSLLLAGCAGRAPAATAPAVKERVSQKQPYAGAEKLPERLASDGTTIVVGDPGARNKVRVYEDPRCPVVEEFESTGGASVLREKTVGREARTEYTFASFLDDRAGGDGSKRAVNALRAALEEGKFVEYHEVLFRDQADVEAEGGFTTDALLALADEVEDLRGKSFDRAVRTMRYAEFVTASQGAYDSANGDEPLGPGTPTVVINGRQVPEKLRGALFDKDLFPLLLPPAR
ncbi:DsbA family protein [Streptomyces sp. NPDC003032]